MKAADRDLKALGEEPAGKIDSASKLVRLDADQTDKRSPALPPDRSGDLARPDPDVGFIIGREAEFDIGAEHLAPLAIDRQPIDGGQRIRRDIGLEPLDRI